MANKTPYDLSCLFFTLGCLPLLFLPSLPSMQQWYGVFSLFLLLVSLVVFLKNTQVRCVFFIVIGFLWATHNAMDYLSSISGYFDQKIAVIATVKSANIHHNLDKQTRAVSSTNDAISTGRYVYFNLTEINQAPLHATIPIALLWQDATQPLAGQIWRLTIKTKAAHGYLNEGSFDSQRFAIANRSALKGVIEKAELIDENVNIRQKIVNMSLGDMDHFEYGDIMLALAYGERSRLTEEHKTQLFQTGVAHLMAISGMHILLVALLANRLIRGIQFFLPVHAIYYWHPLFAGWCTAIFYAWLSGFNPPAMRAVIALTLWLILRYKRIQLTPWQMINRVIALLLFFDPLMILSDSFWLSCYAVVCLIFVAQWFPSTAKRRKYQYIVMLFRLQLFLIILLFPIQLIIFNGTSGSSFISNLIAIPVISFITLPAIMIMLVVRVCHGVDLSMGFGWIADQSLSWLFIVLKPLADYWVAIPYCYYGLSGIGWLCLISWRIGLWQHHFFTMLLVVVIMLSPIMKNNAPRWQVDVLDVGHGLAIVIRQGKSAILYDTGAKWQTSSAAERIILPFLNWHDLSVDGMIISHEHNDHIGGLDILRQHYPNAWIMSSTNQLAKHTNNHYQCVAGNVINWHDLNMTVLWPNQMSDVALNPESCVIRISDGKYSLLLTGDLERKQEELLVLKYGKSLFSTILQIPHHGSNTSSFYAFLAHVNPNISVGSVSRYNPWKLPSRKALSRYHELNIDFVLTSETGQVSFLFYPDEWLQKRLRYEIKSRWYHDWFGTFPNYR